MDHHAKMVERATYALLTRLPYYGAMVQSFKLCIGQDVPTAAVGFDRGGKCVVLYINPEWFGALTDAEREAVLIHEVSHVDRLHLIRCATATDHRRANIAADMAINCYIPGLPEGGVHAKAHGFADYKTYEYYYEALDSKRGEAVPAPTTDDHGQWGDASGLSTDAMAEVIEQTMRRAIEKMGNGAGQLPQHVTETLTALKDMRTKPWHRELRKFLGRTVNAWDQERTWSRRNRRYGLQEAGTRTGHGKKLAVAFDTSGSMSVDELSRCLTEVRAMLKRGVSGHLIQFTTQVTSVAPLTRATEIAIVDRGGTSFVDLMERVDRMGCDALVVFTDGDDSGTCQQPKTPVLWVYTDGDRTKYSWGRKTLLERNKQ